MSRTGIITQARMTSTRLPGKVLLRADGRTMLDHHLDRLSEVGVPVIVATTTNASDDPLVTAALDRGIDVFRGSESDVLGRFSDAAADAGLDTVVRVTSDCPLIDPAPIRDGIRLFDDLGDPYAYVSNVLERTFPRGFDFEVFSAAALHEAHRDALDAPEREHVTPYLYNDRSGRVTRHAITRDHDASRYRVTLDTTDDLTVIRRLIEEHGAATLDASGIIDVLDRHPELARINEHVEQKKLGE